MKKVKFERTLPHCNIATIGHLDHERTTLTALIGDEQQYTRAVKQGNTEERKKYAEIIAEKRAEIDENYIERR